jgi:hypothetical protein
MSDKNNKYIQQLNKKVHFYGINMTQSTLKYFILFVIRVE